MPDQYRCELTDIYPVVDPGGLCIEVTPASTSEALCLGWGVYVKRRPHQDTKIVQPPERLGKDITHRYGPGSFLLHSLPVPRPGEVLGLVGTHSIGKSTALKVLAGVLKPNLGRFNDPPEWPEILTHFRDKELQSYLTQILEKKLKVVVKPQHVHEMRGSIPRVRMLLDMCNERGMLEKICDDLELNNVLDFRLNRLSAGMLQKVIIAAIALQKADVYIFDEVSTFLDGSYVIVVENDLSVLDYMSDTIYCLSGKPEAYGVFGYPYNVRAGIEIFLDGYDPVDKVRIRDESLIFEAASHEEMEPSEKYKYPSMKVTRLGFRVEVAAGELSPSQILVVLGMKCTGKTTFIEMLAGLVPPDEVDGLKVQPLPMTKRLLFDTRYKRQKNVWTRECTVKEMLEMRVGLSNMDHRFVSDVIKPLQIVGLLDRELASLSCGETQRVAITLCLASLETNVYLIDEPSAYLDAEQRINVAMVIKRHVKRLGKAAIIVEHDIIMATYLADRVILAEERTPKEECIISPPISLARGMNTFLMDLDVTVKRNPKACSFTPRVNKLGSIQDTEQKGEGQYYSMD